MFFNFDARLIDSLAAHSSPSREFIFFLFSAAAVPAAHTHVYYAIPEAHAVHSRRTPPSDARPLASLRTAAGCGVSARNAAALPQAFVRALVGVGFHFSNEA